MAANAERISREEMNQQIQALQREPFRALLGKLLQCEPTTASLQKFANKSPDRWYQAMTMAMKAAGYQEKTVHEHNFNVKIQQMSDLELMQQNQELEDALARQNDPRVIEHDSIQDEQKETKIPT